MKNTQLVINSDSPDELYCERCNTRFLNKKAHDRHNQIIGCKISDAKEHLVLYYRILKFTDEFGWMVEYEGSNYNEVADQEAELTVDDMDAPTKVEGLDKNTKKWFKVYPK